MSTKGQTFDDQGPLPPGWKTRMDPVKNRRCYYNRSTNQTQWTRPKDPNAVEAPKISVVDVARSVGGGSKASSVAMPDAVLVGMPEAVSVAIPKPVSVAMPEPVSVAEPTAVAMPEPAAVAMPEPVAVAPTDPMNEAISSLISGVEAVAPAMPASVAPAEGTGAMQAMSEKDLNSLISGVTGALASSATPQAELNSAIGMQTRLDAEGGSHIADAAGLRAELSESMRASEGIRKVAAAASAQAICRCLYVFSECVQRDCLWLLPLIVCVCWVFSERLLVMTGRGQASGRSRKYTSNLPSRQ